MADSYIADHLVPRRRKRRVIEWGLIALLIVIASGLAFGYWQKQAEVSRLERKPAEEAARLIAAVGSHMALPKEKATIATVEDTKKLQGQAFFEHAQNGDKVLIYAESKKAVLYRPSTDKIIEVAHLNLKPKS